MSSVLRMNCRGIKKINAAFWGNQQTIPLWLSPLRLVWSHSFSWGSVFEDRSVMSTMFYETNFCFCSWLHNHRTFKIKMHLSGKRALEKTSTLGSSLITWSDGVLCLFSFARFYKFLLILESWFYVDVRIWKSSYLLFFSFPQEPTYNLWYLNYEGTQLVLSLILWYLSVKNLDID